MPSRSPFPLRRLVSGLTADRNLRERTVALESRIQFARIDCQQPGLAKMTRPRVQVDYGHLPPVGGKRCASHRLLISFHDIGTCRQQFIETAKIETA